MSALTPHTIRDFLEIAALAVVVVGAGLIVFLKVATIVAEEVAAEMAKLEAALEKLKRFFVR